MSRKMRDSGVEWIGQVPEGWGIQPLKTVVCQITERAEKPSAYIGLENVESWTGRCVEDGSLPIDGMAILIQPNDVLFGKLRPYLAKCIEAKAPGCCSTEFLVLRTLSACSTYLKYLMLSPAFIDCVNMSTYGTKMPRANWDYIRQIQIPVPAILVQRSIANYLDTQCSEIDAAIAAARQSIEEYKALKKSLVVDKVFGGLDAGELRDVGDDWCPPIPNHWAYKQIRYLFELRDERNDKPLSEVNLISLYTDKGVVQHCDLEKTTGNKASTADGYKLVYEDDIVVNIILCWMGAVGRSAYMGVTSPAYDVYKTIAGADVSSRYYHYLFRTDRFNGKCYQEGRGIMMMRWRTYSSEFRAIKVPAPPLAEQLAIADYLDEKCRAIDALMAEKESLIADLEAYKKSLIFEVVTGKREVA